MSRDVHGAAQGPQPDTPDPVEIAMREVNAGAPEDSLAAAVLRRHARLIDAQIAGERMGLALKVLTAAVGLVFAVALKKKGTEVINVARPIRGISPLEMPSPTT
ncbi:hypothetical protein [Luteimonas vadosa]|uniref:Uncharacterized protein n=1 Tax=Luteimonas vadosa TaxID=1165507 RepID=A0ABP9E1H8_9GAMM